MNYEQYIIIGMLAIIVLLSIIAMVQTLSKLNRALDELELLESTRNDFISDVEDISIDLRAIRNRMATGYYEHDLKEKIANMDNRLRDITARYINYMNPVADKHEPLSDE